MQTDDWLKTISLFLWVYFTSAFGLILLYFYGICRLAERKFEGRTFAFLLLPYFVLMSAGNLLFSFSSNLVTPSIWYAIWPWVTSMILFFVVFRAYRVMMG